MQQDRNDSQPRRGNVRYLWILVAGYLFYLSYQLIAGLFSGGTKYPVLSVLFAAVFAVTGGVVLWREWQAYRYALAHKDDPETWSDAPDAVPEGGADMDKAALMDGGGEDEDALMDMEDEEPDGSGETDVLTAEEADEDPESRREGEEPL